MRKKVVTARATDGTIRICDAKPMQKAVREVDARLAALEPAGVVRYVGALPRAQLHLAMAESAAVLNSSSSEGMCNSLLEAMLLRVPVVARANSGNSSLLAHRQTGMLFSTAEECVQCVQAVLREPTLRPRLVSEAAALVAREHSAEAEAAVYARVLAAAHQQDQ